MKHGALLSRPPARAWIVATCAAAILLAQSSAAQMVRPNPDPGITGEGFVDYVGRYGEVFKLRGGWQIDPFMSGGTEVINLYPKFRQDLPEGEYEIFRPKPTDFEPEKFTRLALIQLMIIPRSSAAFSSLDDLKKAKIQDLESSGVRFKVFDHPIFPSFRRDWPAGTFEINILSPYRLSQLYTATSSFTCILTSGLDTPPSTEIRDHSGFLRSGLANWLVPESPARENEDTSSAIIARGISFELFTGQKVWLGWAVITGLAFLLAGGLRLANRLNALRRVSLSVLIFSNAGALLGGALGLVFWPFVWSAHHAPVPVAIACLLMPFLSLLVSRAGGAGTRRRALIGVSFWSFSAAVFLAYFGAYDHPIIRAAIGKYDWGGGDNTRYLFSYNAILGFVFYAIGGIIVGVLDSENGVQRKGPLAALLALLAVFSPRLLCAQDIDAKARAVLADRGVTEEGLRGDAKKNLKRTRVIYDYQRVEIKGVLSKNSKGNDTNATFGPLFDLQIAPTHLGNTKDSIIPDWIQNASGAISDLRALNKDAYNQLSAAADEAVKQLDRKEVNEIAAHSWGTEIVYNAILAGKIWPPRRLIVAGMPDGDLEKWKALSKFTGTEVIVYTNSRDPIAGASRIAGGVVEGAEIGSQFLTQDAQSIALPNPTKQFEQQWTDACAQRADDNACNPHKRRAPETIYRNNYKEGTHNRIEGYYQAMEDAGDLPKQPVEQRLFSDTVALPYPGSAKALQAAQDESIGKEAHRLYAAAVARESRALEAGSVGGDAAFIAGLGDIQTMSREAKLALEKQVHADERATEQSRLAAIRAAKAARAEGHRRAMEQFDREIRAKKYVQSLAGEACSNPDRMNELAEDHGILPVTDLLPPTVYSSYDGTETSGPGSLSRCQRAVIDLFDAARKRRESVTSVNLAQWARRYREANPGLVTKIGRAVSGFFTAFGDLLEVSVESSGGSSSPGERSEGGERQGREEGRCVNTYIPELNQTVRGCPVY